MNVYLIRHGETLGNLEKRYIGVTDEGLCPEGRAHVEALRKSLPLSGGKAAIYVSPLRRCRETAEILFPGQKVKTAEGLRECNFGRFEGHNYQELNGDPEYQAWIDSGGELPFPGGESKAGFSARCAEAFRQIAEEEEADTLVLIVHGGTIMSIMEAFAEPQKSYYDWMLKPAQGYLCRWDPGAQKMEYISDVSAI